MAFTTAAPETDTFYQHLKTHRFLLKIRVNPGQSSSQAQIVRVNPGQSGSTFSALICCIKSQKTYASVHWEIHLFMFSNNKYKYSTKLRSRSAPVEKDWLGSFELKQDQIDRGPGRTAPVQKD